MLGRRTTTLSAALIVALMLLSTPTRVLAWNVAGHQTVAYLAYRHLTPAAKAEVARLLKRHPHYEEWVKGLPDDPDLRATDNLASLLWSRQYTDWRELRFEPLTSPVVRKALAQVAIRMRDTFWQLPMVPVATKSAAVQSVGSSVTQQDAAAAALLSLQTPGRQ